MSGETSRVRLVGPDFTEIDYVRPVPFGDIVHGRLWISGLRKARFDLGAEFPEQSLRRSPGTMLLPGLRSILTDYLTL